MSESLRHLVFAYGSNMHLGDLRRWFEEKGFAWGGIHRVAPATMQDWALVWNYRSPARQGAAANVAPRPGSVLHGAVLEVDDHTLGAIDAKEGHPDRYNRGQTPRPARLYDGSPIRAWLYEVTAPWRRSEPVAPQENYLQLMRDGARQLGLAREYQRELAAIRGSQ